MSYEDDEVSFGVTVEEIDIDDIPVIEEEPARVVQTAPRYGDVDVTYSPAATKRKANFVRSYITVILVVVSFYLVFGKVTYHSRRWIACTPGVAHWNPLSPNASWPYRCSTQGVYNAQSCACCVEGLCWRDIDIRVNSSRMGTFSDVVGGQAYARRLPEWMFVCYTQLTSEDLNCTKIEGLTVGRTLRAIEALNGWPPAGVVAS